MPQISQKNWLLKAECGERIYLGSRLCTRETIIYKILLFPCPVPVSLKTAARHKGAGKASAFQRGCRRVKTHSGVVLEMLQAHDPRAASKQLRVLRPAYGPCIGSPSVLPSASQHVKVLGGMCCLPNGHHHYQSPLALQTHLSHSAPSPHTLSLAFCSPPTSQP